MKRKKWTPIVEITGSLLKFREKRKWQLALRRYVLEKNASPAYALYFGLGIEDFRKWVEIQFNEDLSWDNFGSLWQFDHVVPVAYFDFSKDEELLLCWNFINIRVERIEPNKNRGDRIDIISVKPYYESLYNKTGLPYCLKMIEKINTIQSSNISSEPAIEGFLIKNREYFETVSTFNKEEFNQLNNGRDVKDILLEREIIKKFG